MANPTKGPWKVGARRDGNKEILAGPDGAPLATVYGDDDDSQCWPVTANAQLVAAAPEMLEALKSIDPQHRGAIAAEHGLYTHEGLQMQHGCCVVCANPSPCIVERAIDHAEGR